MKDDQNKPARASPPLRWSTPQEKRIWKEFRKECLMLFEAGTSMLDLAKMFGGTRSAANGWIVTAKRERWMAEAEDAENGR